MGIQAAYTRVDEATLDRLVEMEPSTLAAAVEKLEDDGAPTVYLDKMWDGLHFLLTGVSAGAPIEDNKLSEAVVGVHVFDSDDFIGCTELDELPQIIAALEGVDITELLDEVDFSTFAQADLYPNTWADDRAALVIELTQAFTALLDVHRDCLVAGTHLIVSIL